MAFQQGLSGLNMSAKALDAVGNNIANAQTVGFKSAVTQFADVYAATIGGASSANLVGQGGSIMAVSQTFTQGNVTSTNNPLDIAINGNGFLRFQPTQTDRTPMYSRNGQLHLNSEGYVVNALDQFLNIYPSNTSGNSIDQTDAVPLQLSNAQLPPQPTGYSNLTEPGSGGIKVGINLDVRDKRAAFGATAPQTGWNTLDDWDFSSVSHPSPSMYNYSTSATIYDQRGEPHILTAYFVRLPDTTDATIGSNNWQTHFVLDNKYELRGFTDGTTVTDGSATLGLPLTFGPNGQLRDTADPLAFGSSYTLDLVTNVVDRAGANVDLTIDPLNFFPPPDGVDGFPLTIDFSTATQFGSAFDVNQLSQDGYGPGRLSGIGIDAEGQITARYSNGKTKLQGQIMLATFQNPNGLVPMGNNMWAPSSASGEALQGTPQAGSRGSIQAGAVEEANVDLTQELVSMITLQRAYQANAQTIKTQDQILQTLVNLR